MTMLWTPPAAAASSFPAARPPLWSMRRTALAIVGAIAIGAATTVGISYADNRSGSGSGYGGFGGRNQPGGGFRGGFPGGLGGPGGFGQNGSGQQIPGQPGPGQSGSGQSGSGQSGLGQSGSGQLGSGQLGSQPQPAPTSST
jgi:hypothetical protein